LYFLGVARFVDVCTALNALEGVGLASLTLVAWRHPWVEAKRLLAGGVVAGCIATVAYDIVRVPIVYSGIPVFKAITYFGTVFLGVDRSTPLSEVIGWAYHLSNGVSFALMYAAIAPRPGPVSAVLWGLSLEAAMLLTPYAEVFGYQRDLRFFAITIGSHAVFGLAMWLGLHAFDAKDRFGRGWLTPAVLAVPVGLTIMAADFHRLYAASLPQSPPAYIGAHLYTVWNVPEPDRVAVIWIMKRFVDRDATFHFIEPFEAIKFGTPFDVPEARVRRSGASSATQVLIAIENLRDPRLDRLAHMTALTEVTPWMLANDSEAGALAGHMRSVAEVSCGRALTNQCLLTLLLDLDDWHRSGSGTP